MSIAAKLSLILNALLAGVVVWLALSQRPGAARGEDSPTPASRVSLARSASVMPPAVEPELRAMEINEPFHWSQIETTDYPVYVANLRGIGCPETTVRDILIADLNELFYPRVRLLVDEVSGKFWSLLMRKDDFEKVVNEKYEQLEELKEERDKVFADLFGGDNPRAFGDRERDAGRVRKHWEGVADFLPQEKRARFADAREELERAWTAFLQTPDLTDAQRTAKRKELEADHERALAEWLGPDELAELGLRQSAAANLRHQLVGVDLNEEEMRLAAKIQLAKDGKQTVPSAEDYFQELLGPERHGAYQRATDPRFAPFYRVAQRLELPDTAAAQALDIRKQAEDAAKRLQADKSLADAERQALLQAIGAETRQSLTDALGPKGFPAYEKLDGGWMQQFAAPPK